MVDTNHPWEQRSSFRLRQEADLTTVRLPPRFNWVQFLGCGPGVELLGSLDGAHVLDLGCGAGDNIAYVAARAARATGVDSASSQIVRAHRRWSRFHLALTLVASSAQTFLAHTDRRFDVCYSVFGALEFSDPRVLLPLVASHLKPSSRLVVSVRHHRWRTAPEAAHGLIREELDLGDGTHADIERYEYDALDWARLLRAAGFRARRVLHVTIGPNELPPDLASDLRRRAAAVPCSLILGAVRA